MKRAIKKIIKKTNFESVRGNIKFSKLKEILGLENGVVVNIDQMNVKDKKIECTGDDPKIFIKFNRPVKSLEMTFQVESLFDDGIDLYYSYAENSSRILTEENCYLVGYTNEKKITKEIAFSKPVDFIRIDLGNHVGKLNLENFSIKEKKETNIKPCDMVHKNEYEIILDKLEEVSKKNIIVVTHALNETGAPMLAYHIAKSFKEKEYSVVVISLTDGYLDKKFLEINIPLISLHQSLLDKELKEPKKFEIIVNRLKKKGYNNVITNTIISGITVPFFKKNNFKVISLIHEMYMSINLYNMKQGGSDINNFADRIIFPDKIVYQDFYKIFEENEKKSIICPQGLYKTKEEIPRDYESIYKKYNIPQNAKIILGSGFADFRKGIDLFFNAAGQLINLEETEEYHFVWIGKFAFEDLKIWNQFQHEKCGIENRFYMIDFIEDKKAYQNLVSCADVFWLTSREDPYPSVMIEALEYDTPVVAFQNSGGANALLSDGRGILIPNFSTLEMAHQTKKIIKDKKLQEEMLNKAKKYIAENLNFNQYIQKLEKLIEEVD